jgi:hypothetical protein
MKKMVILLAVTLSAMISCTQAQVKVSAGIKVNADSSAHLSFKGVPIDGTLGEYISKMKQSGFTHIGTEDGVAMLKGDFAAYRNCIVGVATLKQKDLVGKITVIFPECNTWSSLSSNYFSLKDMLTQKYGKPSDCVETFQTYSQPRDDDSKMHHVKFDQCKYYSVYETEKGGIKLAIARGNNRGCFVMLTYFDKINGDIIEADAMNDL